MPGILENPEAITSQSAYRYLSFLLVGSSLIFKESSSIFGYTDIDGILNKPIAISGVIGDSQSSIFANQCFNIGNSKITPTQTQIEHNVFI